MKAEFFLPALGIVCSLGQNKKEIFKNLVSADISGVVARDDFIPNKTVKLACVNVDLPAIPKRLEFHDTRCNQLLLAAYLQIEREVQEAIKKYGDDRVALIIGSGTSGIDKVQKAVDECFAKDRNYPDLDSKVLDISSPSMFLSEYIGLNNINYTVSTACTSSAKAFISAKRLLEMDLCDAVIVGGADDLCKLTVNGFYALESVSFDICNPFSKNRNGITLGEGAAVFLMTRENSDIALLGTGESSDAYHKTAPDPEGKGAITAMQEAIRESGILAESIDYINLHGTGTTLNDSMEALAMSSVFKHKPFCSSTKPMTGHTLGSAGVIEIALCWLILSGLNEKNSLPPHIWDGEVDEKIKELNFVGMNDSKEVYVCMSNSFAFGGSNSSLVIGKQNV